MIRRAPRRLAVGVTVLVLALTAVLTVLAWQANARSEQRLLDRQLAQIGTLLSNQAAVLQTELSDIGQVAVNTNANPNAFARFAAGELRQTGQSLVLWRIGDGQAQQLAFQGVEPGLPAGGPAALTKLTPSDQLVILGILPGTPDRLAYALMPAAPNTDLVIYAETPLPAGHRIRPSSTSPFSGLDLALYLGRRTDPARLLEASGPVPLPGPTRTTTVPFGTAAITVVGSSPTPLTGALATLLPWLVLGVGVALSTGGGLTVNTLARRRAVAEQLAADNDQLYRQQRGIAGTLQTALLPTVAPVHGVQVAARYAAGVDELEVGGDWYDVIERRPGCVVFVVGDVSGRGLPAATTMAALRFALRGFLSDGHGIDAVLTKLRRLLDIDTDHQFATVLLGELDLTCRRLQLVSAGHFPPLLIADGEARPLTCPITPPVGLPAAPAAAVEVALPAAGTLLAFTDGAVERRGEVVDAGIARLAAAAATRLGDRAGPGSPALAEILDDLLGAVTIDGGKDDTVLLGMRWTTS